MSVRLSILIQFANGRSRVYSKAQREFKNYAPHACQSVINLNAAPLAAGCALLQNSSTTGQKFIPQNILFVMFEGKHRKPSECCPKQCFRTRRFAITGLTAGGVLLCGHFHARFHLFKAVAIIDHSALFFYLIPASGIAFMVRLSKRQPFEEHLG